MLESLSDEALLSAGASANCTESEMIPHFLRLPPILRAHAGASWPMLSHSFLASQLDAMDGMPLVEACALWPVSREDVLRQVDRCSNWWAVRILARSPLLSAEDRREKFGRLYDESLLDAGKTLPDIPHEDLVTALDRLSPNSFFNAVCSWPGLTADDVRPHLTRISADNLRNALLEWPAHILDALRKDIEAHIALHELMGN